MRITPALLESALGARRDLADLYAHHLDAACEAYEINTPLRLAHFLAQVGHESGALQFNREIWGPTAAQERYEGRADLGNTQAGDGRRYMGRGLLQTTGRANYRSLRDRLRVEKKLDAPDFEAAPELLEQPRWAALSACDYWEMRNINALADRDDHEAVTRAVNGGTNGIEDRRRRLERAKAVLAAIDTPPAPEPAGDPTQYSQEGGMPIPIAPVVAALAPTFLEMLPKLGAWFGSGSKVSERNMAVVGEAIKLAQTTVGAVNAMDAVEKMQSDPAARAAVEKAVEANWYTLTEAGGGGIEGARKAAEAYAQPDGPRFWLNPAFWITLVMLLMPFMLLVDVLYVNPSNYSGDLRTQIVTAVLLIIGIAGGYWLGTSYSSARKTELSNPPR